MAGQGGLDRDFRGFAVADFADHDHVGVLAQNRTQTAGKRQLDLRIHLHLADAAELVLDRILDRNDVLLGRVDSAQTRVQRRGFSRAGRPSRQDDPVALPNQPVDALQVVAGKSEMVEVDGFYRLRAVEQAQHDALAERGRYRRYAQVDIPARDAQSHSAV